jgi:hypothetical protein
MTSWTNLARGILKDDEVWQDDSFCEVVDRHLQTQDWAADYKTQRDCIAEAVDFDYPLETDPEEYEYYFWTTLEGSAPEVMAKASGLMRKLFERHPEALFEAMSSYNGGCSEFFVAFEDEQWVHVPRQRR